MARYANNSNYRNDSLIRKESAYTQPWDFDYLERLMSATVCVSSLMIQEIKRIIKDSEIMKYVWWIARAHYIPAECSQNYREDDTKWPQKNKDGRQELEIRLGSEHISFEVSCFYTFIYLCILADAANRPPR